MTHKKKPTKNRDSVQYDERDQKSFIGNGNCAVCGVPLCTKGGCAGTGMCGPCCTGEADTAGEF